MTKESTFLPCAPFFFLLLSFPFSLPAQESPKDLETWVCYQPSVTEKLKSPPNPVAIFTTVAATLWKKPASGDTSANRVSRQIRPNWSFSTSLGKSTLIVSRRQKEVKPTDSIIITNTGFTVDTLEGSCMNPTVTKFSLNSFSPTISSFRAAQDGSFLPRINTILPDFPFFPRASDRDFVKYFTKSLRAYKNESFIVVA